MAGPGPDSGTVTKLLLAWRGGDARALDALMPHVYDELLRMARRFMRSERQDHTLQATALVHEAYGRLIDCELSVEDRAHFLGVAASVMRRILVDHARAKRREKRGGDAVRVTLEEATVVSSTPPGYLLEINDALERLAKQDERKAKVVELHFFGGLTWPEIAQVLKISEATVARDLRMARAWLRSDLASAED